MIHQVSEAQACSREAIAGSVFGMPMMTHQVCEGQAHERQNPI